MLWGSADSQAQVPVLLPEVKYLGGCAAAPQGLFPCTAVPGRVITTAYHPSEHLRGVQCQELPLWTAGPLAGEGEQLVTCSSWCGSKAACLGHDLL